MIDTMKSEFLLNAYMRAWEIFNSKVCWIYFYITRLKRILNSTDFYVTPVLYSETWL